MLAVRLSPHLEKLTRKCPAIYNQFMYSEAEEKEAKEGMVDPLAEEEYTAVRGLVHKYGNRALVLLTMNCAAYCRFCTRRRSVSDIKKGVITSKDFDNMVAYLKKHPEIKELIFSGGDPLTVPKILKMGLKKLTTLPQIKIVRVGTRVPVSNPRLVTKEITDILKIVKDKPLYILVNFEHPAEITKATIQAVKRLQKVSTMLLSQSVSLRGVNDNEDTLYELFSRLVEIGVKPYYFFRCDPVKGAEHFIVPLEREVQIFTKLRSRLSGLATPNYVVDAPNGVGKIPVPLDYWQYEKKKYTDFHGQEIEITD